MKIFLFIYLSLYVFVPDLRALYTVSEMNVEALKKDPKFKILMYETGHQVASESEFTFTVALLSPTNAADYWEGSLELIDPADRPGTVLARIALRGTDIHRAIDEYTLKLHDWKDFKSAEVFSFTVKSKLLATSKFYWEIGPRNNEKGIPKRTGYTQWCYLSALVEAAKAYKPEGVFVRVPWKSQKINLYSPAGEVTVVDAKRVMVEFNGRFDVPFVVFINPKTGNAWAGREGHFYFETDAGITAGWLGMSILQWDKSLVPKIKSGENLEDAVNLINNLLPKMDPKKVFQDTEPATDLTPVVRDYFFSRFEFSSGGASAKLNKFEIKDGSIQLDLESAWGPKASVWINLETRTVLKVVENGKQTFPNQAAK